jgi:hypothetical protein
MGCSKPVQTEKLYDDIAYFDKVELQDSFEVFLIEGNEFSIKVSGDQEVIKGVDFYLEDSTLIISNKRKLKWLTPTKNSIKIYITSMPLKVVRAHQTCYISTVTPITSEEFGLEFHSKANEANLELNGNIFYYWNNFQCGGKLTLSGNTDILKLWNFAAVTVDAKNVQARYAIVENSSTGDCIVNVSERIDYAIKGKGNISLFGSPTEINETEMFESTGQLIVY